MASNLSRQPAQEPIYRLLNENDLSEICDMMENIKPPIAGMCCRAMYSSISRYALKDKRLVFLVAEYQNKLIGFTIAIIEWYRFWRAFLFRHPILAVRIVIYRFARFFRNDFGVEKIDPKYRNFIEEWIASSRLASPWKDSSPKIAKVLYTAISREHRRSGVAMGLQRHRDRFLAQLGVRRLDATVDTSNISAVILNYRRGGWRLAKKGGRLFLTRDISLESANGKKTT